MDGWSWHQITPSMKRFINFCTFLYQKTKKKIIKKSGLTDLNTEINEMKH